MYGGGRRRSLRLARLAGPRPRRRLPLRGEVRQQRMTGGQTVTLGSAVPPRVFLEKRLDLKSCKGQTKAEELGTRSLQFLSLRLALKAL